MTNGKRILIVDDDPVLLEMLSEQLQLHEEFLTSGAATAGEALEQAKEDYEADTKTQSLIADRPTGVLGAMQNLVEQIIPTNIVRAAAEG